MHRPFLLKLAFLLAAAWPADAVAAETRRFGDWVVPVPAGAIAEVTETEGEADALGLFRDADGDGEVDEPDDDGSGWYPVVHLTLGEARQAGEPPLRAWAEAYLAAVLVDPDDLEDGQTPTLPAGAWEARGPWQAFGFGDPDAQRMVMAAVRETPVRRSLVFVEAPLDFDDRAGSQARLEAAGAAMDRVMTTAGLISDGAADPVPPPTPQPMQGVWWATDLKLYQYGVGNMQTHLDRHVLTLHGSGQWTSDLPPGGVHAIGPHLAYTQPQAYGSWRLDGGRLTLTNATNLSESLPFDRSDETIDIPGFTMDLHRGRLLPDGFRFDAHLPDTFHSTVGSLPGAANTTSVSVSRTSDTYFAPDGTLRRERFAGSSTYASGSTHIVGSNRYNTENAAGRYEVRGGAVVVTLPDGRSDQLVLIYGSREPRDDGYPIVLVDNSFRLKMETPLPEGTWFDRKLGDPAPARAAANPLDAPGLLMPAANPLDAAPVNPLE